MYTVHRDMISGYESSFPPAAATSRTFRDESFVARNLLLTAYASFTNAPAIDGEVLVGSDTGDLLDQVAGVDLSQNDLMLGEGGNDFLYGNGGADVLYGGAGGDTLQGDAGNDHLFGGDEDDRLRGGDGTDVLEGGEGNDQLSGGAGIDTLRGGIGNDKLRRRRQPLWR